MFREFLLYYISVGDEHFDDGFGESLHIPLPDLRVGTLQLGDHVEALC